MSTASSPARRTSCDHTSDVEPALVVGDAHKSFGKVRAVDGMSFTADRGEIVALLGPNGADKTTTLDMVLDLSWSDAGSISVFGGNPCKAIDGGRLSVLLQSSGLLREYTIYEIVAMVSGILTASRPIDEILERTNLTEIAERQIGKCSGGEQQRVRFALVLLSNPEFIIPDEPTAGMDVNARRHFWEAMHAEAEGGMTIIFAAHYLAEAETFTLQTIIMNREKIVADDGTAQIRHNLETQHTKLTFDTQENLAAASAYMARRATVPRSTEILSISGPDAVALVREVVAFPGISSISITDRSLEEAFEQLTDVGNEAAVPPKES